MLNLTPYILALPLLGFVLIGLFGQRWPKPVIATLACGVVLLAFGAAVADLISMLAQVAAERSSDTTYFVWLTSGSLTIHFGLLSDPLSAVMLLIVTGVGFLIHLYSVGYMEDDAGYWRFFAFLNFFVFAMTLLVAADNFLFLLVGWAGVGLASFLLIGFWYTRPAAVAAAKKAFVVNVIGDFGLLIAIFLLVKFFGTLDYAGIFSPPASPFSTALNAGTLQRVATTHTTALTMIALALLLAAAAKSAQLPLHVWLPDAMEGPTPVSALIHAATMVTAGVYLVARAQLIFTAVPVTLVVIGIVAAASALFAATCACAQTDIKRVLAYSTMSQLAYMFMGEAAGGFSAGIFHLTTHAFYKALLFLAAGAVIHAVDGEQDLRRMGGLRARLPYTFWMFVIGGLSLAAIVPFAGFWSKDAILGGVLATAQAGSNPVWWVVYAVAILTAGLTGFYIFRLIFTVFLGDYRASPMLPPVETGAHRQRLDGVHEPGMVMLVPMTILAVLATIGGFDGLPFADGIEKFLEPVLGTSPEVTGGIYWLSLALGLAVSLIGIGVAWVRYGSHPRLRFVPARGLAAAALHGYYLDAAFGALLVTPVLALGTSLRRVGEDAAFDGGGQWLARGVVASSRALRSLQTGYARNYALAIFVGAALILLFYLIHP
jgi:NADH-quinone oxidoreductase subunit L